MSTTPQHPDPDHPQQPADGPSTPADGGTGGSREAGNETPRSGFTDPSYPQFFSQETPSAPAGDDRPASGPSLQPTGVGGTGSGPQQPPAGGFPSPEADRPPHQPGQPPVGAGQPPRGPGQPLPPYPGPQAPGGPQPGAPRPDLEPGHVAPRGITPREECTHACASHWLPILVGFMPALVFYLADGPWSRFVKENARRSLNFELTLLIAYAVASILMTVFIGFFLLPIVWICSIVFHVQAAIAANKGQTYKYPITIEFVK